MTHDLPPLKCNGCTVCCEKDTISLVPGDNPALYKTRIVDGERVLQKKKNGNCIYLTKNGCSIYFQQPQMCRVFDCRVYAINVTTKLSLEEQLKRQGNPALAVGLRKLRNLNFQLTRGAAA